MKKSKMLIVISVITMMFFGTLSSALAYTGSFSFDIRYSVTGSDSHSLDSTTTTTTASGQTYDAAGNVNSAKSSFTVSLTRFLRTYVTDPITANNLASRESFGEIASGNYRVAVSKYSATGDRIIGDGTINQ